MLVNYDHSQQFNKSKRFVIYYNYFSEIYFLNVHE